MRKCDVLLMASRAITQNDSREIVENVAVAIERGIIRAIGKRDEIVSQWQADKTLDLGAYVILPGLVNAHTHAAMTFLRGLADDRPLMEWLTKTVFPIESRLTYEIVRLGTLLGHAEMLASGCTASIDMYIFENAVLDAAEISGMRCMGGEAVFAFPSAAHADYRQMLDQTRQLAERYAGHDRIYIAVNSHSVYTTSPEILADCRALALAENMPLHIHLAESGEETRACVKAHGKRPVEYLESLGIFDCRVIAAHLVDLTDAEIEFLGSRKIGASHNPASNMKLASGIAPAEKLLNAGVILGLGTDGPASNNQLNMFADMRLAALLGKIARGDPSALPASTVLDMATINGGKLFHEENLGRLVPGACADIIALDVNLPNMQPFYDAASQLVYAASGAECRMSMVGGEVLYEKGKFTRFNYDDVLGELASLREFVARREN